MKSTRREFLQVAATGGVALGLGALLPTGLLRSARGQDKADKKLRILFIGGTGFLGPHTVQAGLDRGHEMTLFNRGKTNPELFSDLEKLKGDRKSDLSALEGRKWDAVIDTCGYVPKHVKFTAEFLADAVKQYVFISSISVYKAYEKPNMDETAAVGTLEDPTVEKVDGETYGPLKALCEQAAEAALPGRATNIRPGLIVGPRDPSDRFTYWPVRVARGGEVLAPGEPDNFIQFIDVRDLGEFIIRCLEQRHVGVFNADSPSGEYTIGKLLKTCKQVSQSDAKIVWADKDFLEKNQVQAWSDMPVWVPQEGEYAGFGRVSTEKAVKAGLKFRPITTTVKDTLEWWKTLPAERQEKLRAGIKPGREKEVLLAWHKQHDELKGAGVKP